MSDASGTPLALHVRPAETADAAGIARVHVEGWRAAYRGLLPQAFLDDLSVESRTQFWQRAIQHPLPRSISHVAIHNDEVVGFCACGPAAGTDAPETRGEIAAIYIDPPYGALASVAH